MKNLLTTVLLTVIVFTAAAQSSAEYRAKQDNCQAQLADLRYKKGDLDYEYGRVVAEFKAGLFCSLCNHSKSQIEKGGEEFYGHIKRVQGQVVQAPQSAYDQAYREYTSKVNTLQSDLARKERDCQSFGNMAVSSFNNEVQKANDDKLQRQKDAQNKLTAYNNQQTANNNQQQKLRDDELKKQQDAANLQLQQSQKAFDDIINQQKATDAANKLALDQQISQNLSNYANMLSASGQQKKQEANDIATKGNQLAQSIQNNRPDANLIVAPSLATSSIFDGLPTYEDILNQNSGGQINPTRFEQLKNDFRDFSSGIAGSLSNKWNRLKETVVPCIKCIWKSEPIRDYIHDEVEGAVEEKLMDHIEEFVKPFPIISRIFTAAKNVKPVYEIRKSAEEVVGRLETVIGRFGKEDFDEKENAEYLDEGLDKTANTVFSNIPVVGKYFSRLPALKSLFNCSKPNGE